MVQELGRRLADGFPVSCHAAKSTGERERSQGIKVGFQKR